MAASSLAEIAQTLKNKDIKFDQLQPQPTVDNDHGLLPLDDILYFLNITNLPDNIDFDNLTLPQRNTKEIVCLICAYTVIVLISLFGNVLVCRVVWLSKRNNNVTYMFLGNMAVSDLLMTVINIPFNLARNILEEWVFGSFMCHMVNFSLVTSVYVSTFTMTSICLDRYQVILHPMSRRITKGKTVILLIALWVFAALLASPYAVYSQKIEIFIYAPVVRCQMLLPKPHYRKYLMAVTCATQYVLPLIVIAAAYSRISCYLWRQGSLGDATAEQQDSHQKNRRRTIKMLVLVVIVFALCWLPLNVYHLVATFHPNRYSHYSPNGTMYFTFHWFAMSSVCYNPFIYCWLNDVFRAETRCLFRCCYKMSGKVHPGVEFDGILVRADAKGKFKTYLKEKQSSLHAPLTHTTSTRAYNSNSQGSSSQVASNATMRQAVCVTSSASSIEARYVVGNNSVLLKIRIPKSEAKQPVWPIGTGDHTQNYLTENSSDGQDRQKLSVDVLDDNDMATNQNRKISAPYSDIDEITQEECEFI